MVELFFCMASVINFNMRCIEINYSGDLKGIIPWINFNMRCIEMEQKYINLLFRKVINFNM